jgi:hypothetical protein
MAVLIFSGGHTLRVPGPAEAVISGLELRDGEVSRGWRTFESGTAQAYVNPQQIAYVVDDRDYDETFGPQA